MFGEHSTCNKAPRIQVVQKYLKNDLYWGKMDNCYKQILDLNTKRSVRSLNII